MQQKFEQYTRWLGPDAKTNMDLFDFFLIREYNENVYSETE